MQQTYVKDDKMGQTARDTLGKYGQSVSEYEHISTLISTEQVDFKHVCKIIAKGGRSKN